MDHSTNPERASAVERLLNEGARSYLEAVTALTAYQLEIQKRCRRVLEQCVQDYAAALKVPLNSSEIAEFAAPPLAKWTGDWASLGVQIHRNEIIPVVREWGGYCSLGWQLEEPRLYCWVGEWYVPGSFAKQLFQRFTSLNPNVTDKYKGEVGILKSLTADEGGAFEETMQHLFEEWINLWRKAGGIKAVFSGK